MYNVESQPGSTMSYDCPAAGTAEDAQCNLNYDIIVGTNIYCIKLAFQLIPSHCVLCLAITPAGI